MFKTIHLNIVVALLLCLVSGCTSITQAGNWVLNQTGLGEESSSESSKESLAKSTKNFTEEGEYYLGRAVAARILKIYPESSDPKLLEYLNSVGLVVAAASDRPVTFGGYHFVIVKSDQPNALSAPGGFIFISTGLLKLLKNEDELAAILAHEVSHVEKRHGILAISQEHSNAALDAFGPLAGSLSCNLVTAQSLAILEAAIDDIVDTLLENGFSRDQEFEADSTAVNILYRSGYDPKALVEALNQLDHAHKQQTGWFKTHPSPKEREAKVENALKVVESSNLEENQGMDVRTKRFQAVFSEGIG